MAGSTQPTLVSHCDGSLYASRFRRVENLSSCDVSPSFSYLLRDSYLTTLFETAWYIVGSWHLTDRTAPVAIKPVRQPHLDWHCSEHPNTHPVRRKRVGVGAPEGNSDARGTKPFPRNTKKPPCLRSGCFGKIEIVPNECHGQFHNDNA